MKFQQLHSGADGNLYVLTARNGSRLLIECGVRWPLVMKALNYDLTGIVGCLISHSHQDHCKAAMEVLTAGIPVYASYHTLQDMNLFDKRNTNILLSIHKEKIGCFEVFNYESNHDCEGSLLFCINVDDEMILYATDTSHITQKFVFDFKIIAIECSFDDKWLRDKVAAGEIDERLAERLLHSHLSKKNCMDYLKSYVDMSACEVLHLIHMSGTNIDRQRTAKEFKDEFFMEVITI